MNKMQYLNLELNLFEVIFVSFSKKGLYYKINLIKFVNFTLIRLCFSIHFLFKGISVESDF